MSVNKERRHVLVLPEDDANRQLANGFQQKVDWTRTRQMQVLKVAGGRNKVLDLFESEHLAAMDRWHNRFMVLLIDFDGDAETLNGAKARIPAHLTDRVFILGALGEPEDLKRADLGSYETIGKTMAEGCYEGIDGIWGHELLRHNASELERLREQVCPILFPSS